MENKEIFLPICYENQSNKTIYNLGQCYEILMNKYANNKAMGWSVADFFDENNKTIVLYGISEMTRLIYNDLSLCGGYNNVMYICDRNWKTFKNGYCSLPVKGMDDLIDDYRNGFINHIIICNVRHCNEVSDELIERGVDMNDFTSLTSVLFSF